MNIKLIFTLILFSSLNILVAQKVKKERVKVNVYQKALDKKMEGKTYHIMIDYDYLNTVKTVQEMTFEKYMYEQYINQQEKEKEKSGFQKIGEKIAGNVLANTADIETIGMLIKMSLEEQLKKREEINENKRLYHFYNSETVQQHIEIKGRESTLSKTNADFVITIRPEKLNYKKYARDNTGAYHYSIWSSLKLNYNVYEGGRKVIKKGSVESDLTEINTNVYSSKALLEVAWNETIHHPHTKQTIEEMNTKSFFDCVDILSEELSDIYGEYSKEHEFTLGVIKAKKYNYDDVENAKKELIAGLNKLITVQHDAEDNFRSVINTTINVLKEHNPTNKKARINNDVFAAIQLNMSYAYLFLGEFENATIAANNASKKYPKASKKVTDLAKDFKSRF